MTVFMNTRTSSLSIVRLLAAAYANNCANFKDKTELELDASGLPKWSNQRLPEVNVLVDVDVAIDVVVVVS